MIEAIRNNPEIKAIQDRFEFATADVVVVSVDLNNMRSDYRRVLAERHCLGSSGRWSRRVRERQGDETIDTIEFRFADIADGDRLRDFLARPRGW